MHGTDISRFLAGKRDRPAHASTQNSISNVYRVNDALKVACLGKQLFYYIECSNTLK